MREVQIESETGTLSATIFEAVDSKAILVISSATGVKQSFYKKFAEYIFSQNITVLTYDYSGIGLSLNKPIKKVTNNAADWGVKDLNAILRYVVTSFPNHKKSLLGHSIGGQLIGLSKSSLEIDKIILVAAQSGYWKFWRGFGQIKMWFNWYVLFPSLTNVFGYLPAKKLSGMENLPKNVANQWSKWSRNSDYILGDKSIKETYFDQIRSELTAFSIDDDKFAPEKAIEWMSSRYLNAKTKSIHLLPKDYNTDKIGHFGVFKDKFKHTLWTELLNEIK